MWPARLYCKNVHQLKAVTDALELYKAIQRGALDSRDSHPLLHILILLIHN